MIDTSHLDTLNLRLSNEHTRLAEAKTEQEKALRKIWVTQIEKEIENEKLFLGIEDSKGVPSISDVDLLSELFS